MHARLHAARPVGEDVATGVIDALESGPRGGREPVTGDGPNRYEERAERLVGTESVAVVLGDSETGRLRVVDERWLVLSVDQLAPVAVVKLLLQCEEVVDQAAIDRATLQPGVLDGDGSPPLGPPLPDEIGAREVGLGAVYGPELASHVGRERLLSAPALANRERDDGGVVLLVATHEDSDLPGRVATYLRDPKEVPVQNYREPSTLPRVPPLLDHPLDEFGLLTFLGDWIRSDVYEAVRKASDDRVIGLLDDERASIRTQATWALNHVVELEERPDLVERLRELLADDAGTVRAAAAERLAPIMGQEGVAVDEADVGRARELVFDDPHPGARASALKLLERAAERLDDADEVVETARTVYDTDLHPEPRSEALIVLAGKNRIGRLVEGLRADERQVRETAAGQLRTAKALLKFRSSTEQERFEAAIRAGIPTLRRALDSDEDRVRTAILEVLGFLDDDEVSDILMDSMDEDAWQLRRATVVALEELATELAVKPLVDILDDPVRKVRSRAAKALERHAQDDPKSVAMVADGLLAALDDEDRDVRRRAAKALGQAGVDAAREPLAELLDQYPTDETFGEALGHIGAAELLFDRFDSDDWDAGVVAGLAVVDDPRAYEPLARAYRQSGAPVIAEALGEFGDARGIDLLIEGILEGHPVPAEALGSFGEPAVGDLIELVDYECHRDGRHSCTTVRRTAAEALGRTGSDQAFEPLANIVESDEKAVRLGAVKGLAHVGDDKVPGVLGSVSRTDPSEEVREEARWAAQTWRRNFE